MKPAYATHAAKSLSSAAQLSAMNERLGLALESSRQVAFDWTIPDDRLFFSGILADSLKGLMLDTSKTWNSSALPSIIHADDKENFRKCLHEALKGGRDGDDKFYQAELRLKDAIRGWRWVNISGRIVERDTAGRAIRMVGTFSDIDERKQSENKITKLSDLYLVLSQTNQAIVRIRDRDTLFSEICRIVVEQGHVKMAWIGLADQNGENILPVAAHGGDPEGWSKSAILLDEPVPHAPFLGAIGSAIRENSPCIYSDINGPAMCNSPTKVELGTYGSVGSFPFECDGKTLGILNLYAAEHDFFDSELVSLLEEMTRDISFAIANYERESQRKRSEALQREQNRILNMVATGVALPEILTEIARFVENQSNDGICSILQLNDAGTLLHDRIAPSLPQTYLDKVGDIEVGPSNCSCGTAAFRGKPVIASDIATDPLWVSRRRLTLEHGLKACTSWPIFGKNRKILGTFALYFRDTAAPDEADLDLFSICTDLAGIAIESRASEEKIRYLAHYDGLTSLPNRFLFKEYLDLALRNAKRHGEKFAVLFLDLDKFKEINDTLGHDAGDFVLREMARRLRSCLRHTDKIARMGGDEFYVLIEELSDGRYAADVAQKLLDEASRPIHIGTNECQLSVSIGIGIYPDDGGDGQTLLKNADKAMYRAKEQGKNAFQFHSVQMASSDTTLAIFAQSSMPHREGKKLAQYS